MLVAFTTSTCNTCTSVNSCPIVSDGLFTLGYIAGLGFSQYNFSLGKTGSVFALLGIVAGIYHMHGGYNRKRAEVFCACLIGVG